jgi:transposase
VRIFRELHHLNVTRDFVYQTVKRYMKTGCIEKRKYPTQKRTVSTSAAIKTIRARIRRKCDRFARSIATTLKVNREIVELVLKYVQGVLAYKKKNLWIKQS